MATKVTRAKRVAKQRVKRSATPARAKAHDRRLLAKAERETAEGRAVSVPCDELKRLYDMLGRAQHEAIKGGAPRSFMWQGWGLESTFKAYETLDIARRVIADVLPEVQS